MAKRGILATFHYVPLHLSKVGRRYGRIAGGLEITESFAERLVRLPLWLGIEEHLDEIIGTVKSLVLEKEEIPS
jgi:dTDP-4-amino-4,6-dideoxygalactose transaminase